MRAVVYDKPFEFDIRQLPERAPGAGEVRLRTRATGVCGTDLHLHAGEFSPAYPLTPGHEIVGEVEALGAEVTNLELGQTVAVDTMVSCGWCAPCRAQRPHYCENLQAIGVTHPGGFAEQVLAPAHRCHSVDDLALDVAVMAEPTACAVHGIDVLALRPGSDVLLYGAGPTGLVLAQLLAHGGAARLTVAAPTAFKLDLARTYGADETVQMRRGDPAASTARLRTLAPSGFDVVIDATGAVSVLEQCMPLVKDGGTLFVYGMASRDDRLAVSPYEIFRRELTVKGSFAQAYSFDRALAVLRSGRVRTDGMLTHHFALDDYGAALDAIRSDPGCLKAAVRP
jgi:2-desacetyl-2-hydroxyethyl bacteriochlorophyllide A dehydrogenase